MTGSVSPYDCIRALPFRIVVVGVEFLPQLGKVRGDVGIGGTQRLLIDHLGVEQFAVN